MPTLHVIDPLLVDQGGHYLSQHVALWNLCQSRGYQMVSYCSLDFDPLLMPTGVEVVATFGGVELPTLNGHYCTVLGASNMQSYQALQRLEPSLFKDDDIVFLTSMTAECVVAYGQWLRELIDKTKCRFGLYAHISSEVDDTLARDIRRHGLPLSDDSFAALDETVVPNEVKRSMYRYLFESIPEGEVERFRIFYEEPFPNRNFIDLAQKPGLRFIYLHSLYPGEDLDSDHPTPSGITNIACLGSGGLGGNGVNKGQHLLAGIVDGVLQQHDNITFTVQLGNRFAAGNMTDIQRQQHELLEPRGKVSIYNGLLSCREYCSLVAQSDLMLLPYSPRYRHIMSGIFDDALYLGKICIIPRQSKMALWMDRHNLDFPMFEKWDQTSILMAIDDALARLPFYQQQAQAAQKIRRESWARNNPIDVFS
ncbi:MAG: hypothetical protein L3J62_05090 [Gammaproteobacteria bacterium]|nr:hypothetical protein [Gammaproteobacteria bacterium]MCF6230159.1 hypothetical protein [Gammaproteobacteria bacterium]